MAPRPAKKSKAIIVSSDNDDELNLVPNSDDSSSDVEEPEGEIVLVEAEAPATPPPTVRKWKHVDKEKDKGKRLFYWYYNQRLIVMFAILGPPKEITYTITLTSAMDMKKTASKRKPKSGNIRLNDNEPYETFEAQMLVQIAKTLKPRIEDISQYEIRCTINRVISKPGMLVGLEGDYATMVASAIKSKEPHIVNLTVEELEGADDANKENENESDNDQAGKRKGSKKVRICR